MTKARPQDEWNASQIAKAVAWSASIFYNRRHNTLRFATRSEAEDMARRMTAVVDNGRRASVYAITPEGFTVYVATPD